ncbi:c-type cytochrome [Azospirillum thermophilum]|uniref:Cytochrome c n=1 Tax=Azospirillum thermophilum TaxID=2202148 RepID=A0A2S2CYE0_9PROT|nr:c-type cytochrome [Azospirillum thermophilum]AWK89435.1 cytochrome c [Azospirillum thermophilum]
MTHALHARPMPVGIAALLFLLLLPLPVVTPSQAAAAGDGETLFRQQCGTCHTVKKDEGARAGPPLYGVLGRKAGTAADFEYSDALRRAGFTWDAGHLERWLTNSNDFLPGSYMNYRQEDDAVRQGIIRFLQSNAAK